MALKLNLKKEKTSACLDLIDIRKQRVNAKIMVSDFENVARKNGLSPFQVKHAWNNFQLYGTPARDFSQNGAFRISDAEKEYARDYNSLLRPNQPDYTAQMLCSIIHEFIFGDGSKNVMTYKELALKYHVSTRWFYRLILGLDSLGCIKGSFETKKIVLNYNAVHGKISTIKAIGWFRHKRMLEIVSNKELATKRFERKYPDLLETKTYENIIIVLDKWLKKVA